MVGNIFYNKYVYLYIWYMFNTWKQRQDGQKEFYSCLYGKQLNS